MTDHPLTDKICDALWDEHGQYYALYEEVRLTCRAAYDVGYSQALEDVQDAITRVLRYKRKDSPYADIRTAYNVGYAESLEDVQDVITCIQRKDSPSIPITLNELKDL